MTIKALPGPLATFFVILTLIGFLGCMGEPEEVSPVVNDVQSKPEPKHAERELPKIEKSTAKKVQEKEAAAPALVTEKLKFKSVEGKQIYALKPASGGAKLVGKDNQELARYTLRKNKVKIKDAKDNPLGWIDFEKSRVRVFKGEGQVESLRFSKSERKWKIEKDGKLLGRLQKRAYGWELEDSDDQTILKVKLKKTKISVENSKGETVATSKGRMSLLAVAAMSSKFESDLKFRAAIGVAFLALEQVENE